MNFHKSTLVAFFAFSLAMPTGLLAQSRPGPRALLGLGTQRQTPKSAGARAVADPVALGLTPAKVYRFTTADFPGAGGSLVFDANLTTVLGDSQFTSLFGFTLRSGNYQAFSVPGSTANETTGINSTSEIVGVYADLSNNEHGFLDNAGVFSNIDIGLGGTTTPFDINDNGEIVGGFTDSSNVTHGFYTLDGGATFSVFDAPGSTSTIAAGVNLSGTIVGPWTDASNKNHGFILSGGTYTSFDFPSAATTTPIGINDGGEIAGYYTDAANVNHGFIYSNGAFAKVDVPGAAGTQLTRIKNKGQITGLFQDSNTSSESHGITGH